MSLYSRREEGRSYCGLYRYIAGFIGLALLLAPLEVPLSGLTIAPDKQPLTAKDSYNDQHSNVSTTEQVFDSSVVATYVRNKSKEPVFNEITSENVVPSNSSLELLFGEPTITSTEAVAPTPVTNTNTRHTTTKRAIDNHRAAVAVAEGNTSSELATVSLDQEGNIVATVDEHGTQKSAEYNEAGQPIRITDADGTTTYYKYDRDGHLLGATREAAVATAPGIRGLVQRLVSPLFAIADDNEEDITFDYNDEEITSATNSSGEVEYEYDEDGLVTLETRFDGSQVEYEYDELGNIVSTIEVPADETEGLSLLSFFRFSYANNPLLTTIREWSTFNDSNQLTNYQIALVTESLTEPLGEGTEPTTEQVPLSPSEIVTESKSDTPTTANEVTSATESETTATTSTTDTASSNSSDSSEISPATSVNVEASVDVPAPTTTKVIESHSSLLESTIETISGLFGATKTALSLWLDSAVQKTFATDDAAPEVIPPAETPYLATSSALYSIEFTYDAQGNVTSSQTNTGVATTYSYDAMTDSLVGTTITSPRGQQQSTTYKIDEAGLITKKDNEVYSYDGAGQLEKVDTTTYTYDERGNRTSIDATGTIYNYEGNRLLSTTNSEGRTTSYTYDERGSVVQIDDSTTGVTNFTYTLGGDIESISRSGETVSYTYDALGRRSTRTSTTDGTYHYHYNSNQLKRVTDDSNNTLREYYYTPTGNLTAIQSNGTYYHVNTSHNKSVTGVIDTKTGNLYTINYDTWGTVVNNESPITLDLMYIGAFSEPAFGYSIFGPRVYNPQIGRFLSKDPLPGVQLDLLSQNEYIYAKNDPVNQYDPSGHASELAGASASPKRSLADTNLTIEILEGELDLAKDNLAYTPETDLIEYATAATDVANIETALAELYTIRTETLAAIVANENATTVADSVESTTNTTPIVWDNILPTIIPDTSTALDTTIVPVTPPVGTTTSDTLSTSSLNTTHSTSETEDVMGVPETESPAEDTNTTPSATDNSVENSSPESTPAIAEDIISLHISDGLRFIAVAVLGDSLLKAEAKSKSKSKSKRAKTEKRKVSTKAKSKQQSTAKQIASITKSLQRIQQTLNSITGNSSKRTSSSAKRAEKRELERISAEVSSIAVKVNTLTLAKIQSDNQKATQAAKAAPRS
jgi:RHS repeat-associated protein